MTWLSQIFDAVKSRQRQTEVGPETVNNIYPPGINIMYDTGLVSRLKSDHTQLLKLYGALMDAALKKDIPKINRYMASFLALFNSHVLTEYTKLYIFLDYAFRGDVDTHRIIMKFRREMNDIGREVRRFYHRWMDAEMVSEDLEAFIYEAKQIGDFLARRVKTEEDHLYKIYDTAPSLMFRR